MKLKQVATVPAALLAIVLLFNSALAVFAQWDWLGTDAPPANWYHIASSADGVKVVAAASLDSIYTSVDSGVTWTSTGLPPAGWVGVASSADGTVLVALATGNCPACSANFGGVYRSTDSGATWITNRTDGTDWHALASSADGVKLVAGALNSIYVSTNTGVTWKPTSAPNGAFSIASSADGAVFAAAKNNSIFVSTDAGEHWNTAKLPGAIWNSVACSADGSKMVAVSGISSGLIYTSTNSGAAWFLTTAPTNHPWARVTSSADGTKLAAAVGYPGSAPLGPIYVSTNSGATWTATIIPDQSWGGLASSADGSELLAGGAPGGIYMYLSQGTSLPLLNISLSGGNVLVSWVIPSMNFVLQQTTDLKNPNWNNVSAQPALNYSKVRYEVSLPPTLAQTFYRLASE